MLGANLGSLLYGYVFVMALFITNHEQTQLNRVCYILYLACSLLQWDLTFQNLFIVNNATDDVSCEFLSVHHHSAVYISIGFIIFLSYFEKIFNCTPLNSNYQHIISNVI